MTLDVRTTTLEELGDPTAVVGCGREAQVVVSVYETRDLQPKVPAGVSVVLEVRCTCGTLSRAGTKTSADGWAVFVIPEGDCRIESWALVVDRGRDPWLLERKDPAFGSLTALHTARPRGALQVGQVPPFETRALEEPDPPAQTLRISNVGNGWLTLRSVTVPAGVFRLSSEERGTQVAPGAFVDVRVDATPASADAVHEATVTVVSSVGNGTAELRASAYELRALAANVSPIAPGTEDADIHYTIADPGGGVGRATITIHEIAEDELGREIASFDGQPHQAGDNTFSWMGAVTHRDYQHGSVMNRRGTYRVKLVIARADGGGPLERTCDVAIKDVGELLIKLERHDGGALTGRATFEVHESDTGDVVATAETSPQTTPDREELLVQGLEPGDYEVRLQDKDAFLAAEGLARVAPDGAGLARVRVKGGERIRVPFELTPYTRVQLVGFHATPTGTNPTTPGALADYKGEPDDRQDMIARCEIMKQAMSTAQAHAEIDPGADVLKVFMAPEFFFRGRGGGYPLEVVEEILPELLHEARKPKYADWLFVYGTAIGYLRHGHGTPDVYGLQITANPGGVPQRVRVKANPALPRHQQCSVAVCKRIPRGNTAPVDWKLRRGAITASIRLSKRMSDDEYELKLASSAPPMGLGPVELVEPESTEVFNMALVQRGGPSPGGTRDRLVAKEYVSSIDFLGHHQDDFYDRIPTHLADIHHTGNRLILGTEGSVDYFNARGTHNPVAAGRTTEHDKSGLGGGALFSMAGLNFGMEVCLDHAMRRLLAAVEQASPGDPKPQVHLIPSWGMEIENGPIYTVANGLVFNVDGRQGAPPKAGTFTGQYRCPDHVHNAMVHAPPTGDCPSQHFRCPGGHPHFETAANCSCCGGPLVAVSECTAGLHLFYDDECDLCGREGLPEVGRECPTHGVMPIPAGPCPTCAHATEPVFGCDAPVHYLDAGTACSCGGAVTPVPHGICIGEHDHIEYAPGNCRYCATPLVPQRRQLQNDWAVLDPSEPDILVPDPAAGRVMNEQTVTTTVVVTPNGSMVATSETTTTTPANTPPLPIPTMGPAVDATTNPAADTVRRKRKWPGVPFSTSSVEDVTTVVGATHTTTTTVVTTTREGTVNASWANLFATQGKLHIYTAQDVPEAEVV